MLSPIHPIFSSQGRSADGRQLRYVYSLSLTECRSPFAGSGRPTRPDTFVHCCPACHIAMRQSQHCTFRDRLQPTGPELRSLSSCPPGPSLTRPGDVADHSWSEHGHLDRFRDARKRTRSTLTGAIWPVALRHSRECPAASGRRRASTVPGPAPPVPWVLLAGGSSLMVTNRSVPASTVLPHITYGVPPRHQTG